MKWSLLATSLAILGATACTPPTTQAPASYAAPALETAAGGRVRALYRTLPPPSHCTPEETGRGAIILLHGLGDVAATWAPVVARAQSCLRRVLVDLPGLGDAPHIAWDDELSADAVIEVIGDLIDRVSPDAPVVLAGHSLGGTIAVRVAAKRPERVAALVVLGSPLRPFTLSDEQRFVVERAGFLAPLVRFYGMYGVSHELVELNMSSKAPIDPAHVGLIARQLGDGRRRVAIQGYARAFAYEVPLAIAAREQDELRCPVWAVSGSDDGFTVHEGTFSRAASVTRRTIPGIGHFTTVEAPADVAAALDAAARAALTASPSPRRRRRLHRSRGAGALAPGDTSWGPWRELHPVIGVASMENRGAWDHAALIGIARGSMDQRWPLEAGRVVALLGATARDDGSGPWRFAYLRATARAELVWRWAGGFHVDGTFAVDPRAGTAGGFAALGYVPSLIPFVRAFAGYGPLPGAPSSSLFGVELDLRLNGLLY